MSTWEDLKLSDLPSEATMPQDTDFVFELLPGSKVSRFDASRLEVAARVAEGEFTGTILYGSYPDYTKYSWVLGVIRRTIKALGGDPDSEDSFLEFLNKKAGTKFVAKVTHRPIQDSEDVRVELKVGSIKAHAV